MRNLELLGSITEIALLIALFTVGIKLRVPIWKREHGPNGPYWVGWESQAKTPGG